MCIRDRICNNLEHDFFLPSPYFHFLMEHGSKNKDKNGGRIICDLGSVFEICISYRHVWRKTNHTTNVKRMCTNIHEPLNRKT